MKKSGCKPCLPGYARMMDRDAGGLITVKLMVGKPYERLWKGKGLTAEYCPFSYPSPDKEKMEQGVLV